MPLGATISNCTAGPNSKQCILPSLPFPHPGVLIYFLTPFHPELSPSRSDTMCDTFSRARSSPQVRSSSFPASLQPDLRLPLLLGPLGLSWAEPWGTREGRGLRCGAPKVIVRSLGRVG